MNVPSLDEAVVLVTGANGGIGTHVVHQALAREVIGDELTAQIKAALSGTIEALYPELRDTSTVPAAVEQ